MPWLLFIWFINFVWLLFESGNYSGAVFISLSQSLCWRRIERSSIEWLLDRQENLLVGCCWLVYFVVLSLLHYFTTSFRMCTCYSSIRHTHCSYYSRAAFISYSMRGGAAATWEWLLIESGVWSSGYGIHTIATDKTTITITNQNKCLTATWLKTNYRTHLWTKHL